MRDAVDSALSAHLTRKALFKYQSIYQFINHMVTVLHIHIHSVNSQIIFLAITSFLLSVSITCMPACLHVLPFSVVVFLLLFSSPHGFTGGGGAWHEEVPVEDCRAPLSHQETGGQKCTTGRWEEWTSEKNTRAVIINIQLYMQTFFKL